MAVVAAQYVRFKQQKMSAATTIMAAVIMGSIIIQTMKEAAHAIEAATI